MLFQSVERICVPSNIRDNCPPVLQVVVSIRRTDLCAFERGETYVVEGMEAMFQSVERICVPSNPDLLAFLLAEDGFNPSNGFVCLRTFPVGAITPPTNGFQSVERICVPSNCTVRMTTRCARLIVSIRRTDLCAFEH